MNREPTGIWPTLLLCTTLLSVGGVAGFFLRPIIFLEMPVANNDESVQDDHDDHGSNIVEVLENSLENLELEIGKLERRDYFEVIRIPARVVELLPRGRRHVTARVAGQIEKVYITQGQAVRPGEKLFDLVVTDQSISQSQIQLLEVLSNIDSNQKQLSRLRPLVEQGVVARKRILEAELESEQLQKKRDAISQSLGVLGMDDQRLKQLIEDGELMREVSVFAPQVEIEELSQRSTGPAFQLASVRTSVRSGENQYFTVESISGLRGTTLEIGDSLCELTHHGTVLVKGMAFESDMERIAKAQQRGWKFSAHFGEGEGSLERKNLELYQIENHVDSESQTFPVLVELKNEIIDKREDNDGRSFVNWLFKPGQRTHLEVPVNCWERQWVVPNAAIVYEGPQAFVFQKINHTHESPEGTIHEFAKTSVRVLHRDRSRVVLEKSDMLKHYEEYVLDNAYQLNLILKAAASGGGHHHHH